HNGASRQRPTLLQPKFTARPQLTCAKSGAGGEKITWTCGKEFAASYLAQTHFSGPLRVIRVDEDDPQAAGAVVLVLGNDRRRQRSEGFFLDATAACARISH